VLPGKCYRAFPRLRWQAKSFNNPTGLTEEGLSYLTSDRNSKKKPLYIRAAAWSFLVIEVRSEFPTRHSNPPMPSRHLPQKQAKVGISFEPDNESKMMQATALDRRSDPESS
jgi:hypothetical protein